MTVGVRRFVPGAIASAVLGAFGCATPSRTLTTRMIDDPAVLPRRLFAFSIDPYVSKFSTWKEPFVLWQPAFAYGITDRLELDSLIALRYAILDDAPAYADGLPDGRRRGRLSLVARAGFDGIGYSSMQGLITLPDLSITARKHLGGSVAVNLHAGADGYWVASPAQSVTPYGSTLWPRGPYSRIWFGTGAGVQVVDHLFLGARVDVHQIYGCSVPAACAWAARGVSTGAGPTLRPNRWFQLRLSGELGARERPFVAIVPDPTGGVPPLPPRDVWWWSVGVDATFYW
jgi:hypothetical protein